jgi:hypothetical protein
MCEQLRRTNFASVLASRIGQRACSRSQPLFVSAGLQFIQQYKQSEQQVHQGRVSIVNRHCFWLNSLAFLPYYASQISFSLCQFWFAKLAVGPPCLLATLRKKGVNGRRILVRRR